MYPYSGKISDEFKTKILNTFRRYETDKTELVQRLRDNEQYYRSFYTGNTQDLKNKMNCSTPLLFSAIENACATSSENFPSANIIERDEDGSDVAETLSKLIDCELNYVGFKNIYKKNTRNKLKYGTAIYGVFYNDKTESIDIKCIDILDIFVDMHLENIQDSEFVFISAAIDNETLKEIYPDYKALFSGDAQIDTLTDKQTLSNRSTIIDCYYKKPDGSLHMVKMCKNNILSATEDIPGYETGIYDHGMYPVVFDPLYTCEHSPFGFGMIDIGKATQIQIDKMDAAITENMIINSKVRYFSKKNGGIDEKEFVDVSRNIVHFEGDGDGIRAVSGPTVNANFINYRESKKDELKELVANRDFQQGDASGGVVSGTAISLLQQSGEKRARSMIDDSYECFKNVVSMTVELVRQFYNEPRVIRSTDEFGRKTFMTFSNDLLLKSNYDPYKGYEWTPLCFDIDIVAQKENPFTRESQNSTMLALWDKGLFNPQLQQIAQIVLKNMNFDGREKILSDIQELIEAGKRANPETATAQNGEGGIPVDLQVNSSDLGDELVPIDISGGL